MGKGGRGRREGKKGEEGREEGGRGGETREDEGWGAWDVGGRPREHKCGSPTLPKNEEPWQRVRVLYPEIKVGLRLVFYIMMSFSIPVRR